MMTREIAEEDLNEVRLLARQAGVAEERLDLLLVQARAADEPGEGRGPRVLLASAGEGTLELALSRWLGEECAEALRQAGLRPLVVGPDPAGVRPRAGGGGWATFRTDGLGKGRGHLVVLAADGGLPARLEGELASAGGWDYAVVVTRASMPLPQAERELVRSLSRVVAVAKVLVVAVPGELPAEGDADQVERYARGKVEANGFGGRCEGVWFWWLDGQRRHPQGVAGPGELLTRDARAVARGRDLMLRSGLANFLREIERKAETSGAKPPAKLGEQDLREMDENLGKALTGVRRKAEAEFRDAVGATDAQLRAFVMDQVVGWGRGNDLAGVWLNYVEAVRPGAKAGLFERVKSAVEVLSLEPAERRTSRAPGGGGPATRAGSGPAANFLADQGVRVGVAVASGIALWAVVSALTAGGVLAAGAAALGALAGLALGGPAVSAVGRLRAGLAAGAPAGTTREAGEEVMDGKVRNFAVFENDLRAWLGEHVRARGVDVVGRSRALAGRINPGR